MMAMKLLSLLILGVLLLTVHCETVDKYEPETSVELLNGTPEEDLSEEVTGAVADREKRQINGAGSDAMGSSLTRNPIGKPDFSGPNFHGGTFQDKKNFNGQFGGSVGTKVWEGNHGQSAGVGFGGRVHAGLSNGRPFVNKPEVGAALGYQRGQFGASVGVQHGYSSPGQRRPSTSFGAGINYRFRRSLTDEDIEDLADLGREKRQISGPVSDAMGKSLTNNPVGKPDVSVHTLQGGGKSPRNFGGAIGGGIGAKAYEKNGHSVGVGLGAQATGGLRNGRPYSSGSEIGVGLGYQKGPYSVSVGAGRNFNPQRPSNNYGVQFGYRFRRSALDDDTDEPDVDELDHDELIAERVEREVSDSTVEVLDEIPEEDLSEVTRREKRQINGAGSDAMGSSLTRNPVGKPDFKGPNLHGGGFKDLKNFHGQVGGSVGTKVWEGNKGQSIGVGLGGRVHTGLSNGRPFVNKPEVGVGLGYQRGRFGASVGVQRGYGSPNQRRPSTSYGVGLNYRFRRSLSDEDIEDLVDLAREKRQISGTVSDAMGKSLTNNPVGKPDFGLHTLQGAGKSPRNFGGAIGGGVGTKVWEKNGHSVGVGLSGLATGGLRNGRPYSSGSEIGVGIGYQKGPYSVSVGASRNQNPYRPSNNFGAQFGYRFRRSALDDELDQPEDDEVDHEELFVERAKRQISDVAGMAMNKAVDPRPYGDVTNKYFHDRKNFGGRVIGGVGTTIHDTGRHRIGVGISGASNVGVHNGRPYATPPRPGVGLSYQRGPVTTTFGVDHGRNPSGRKETNFGLNVAIDPFHRG